MRAMFNMAQLYVRISLQNNGTLFLAFGMPILMMFLLGAAMSGMGDVILPLDVVNEDIAADGTPTALSAQFIEQLQSIADEGETVIICVYGSENPDDCDLDKDTKFADSTRVKDGDVAAAIIIPAGFEENLKKGESVTIAYQSNEGLASASSVTRTVVDTATGRFAGSMVIATTGINAAQQYFQAETSQANFDALLNQAQTSLENPPAKVMKQSSADKEVESLGANQSVPGIATMFVLMSTLGISADLINERQQGTLQRLFTLPIPKAQIVAGKILGGYTFGIIQFATFIIAGTLLGVEWGSNYPAIVLVALVYTLTTVSLGFLLATIVKTVDQAAGISVMVSLVLSPLGGAWWPLEIVPDFMQTLGHISPVAWAMDAFNDIIYNNGGIADILPPLAVLAGLSVIFIALAISRFRYE